MPLSEPTAREPLHRRTIDMVGYRRADGLFDIEAHLIDTKTYAVRISQALDARLGAARSPLTIHWSGCPAGCGNHQAADIGFRGLRANIGGEIVDAVAIYTGGRTGPDAVAGQELLDLVRCDDNLPDIVAGIVRARERLNEAALEGNPDLTEETPNGLSQSI